MSIILPTDSWRFCSLRLAHIYPHEIHNTLRAVCVDCKIVIIHSGKGLISYQPSFLVEKTKKKCNLYSYCYWVSDIMIKCSLHVTVCRSNIAKKTYSRLNTKIGLICHLGRILLRRKDWPININTVAWMQPNDKKPLLNDIKFYGPLALKGVWWGVIDAHVWGRIPFQDP